MTSKAESPDDQIAQDAITATETAQDDKPVAEDANNAADAKPEALDVKNTDRYLAKIVGANAKLHKRQAEVARAEAAVEQARGNLKAAIGDRDAAVIELQKIIEGKGRPFLPGMEDADVPVETQTKFAPSENTPISELGAKQLTKLVGKEVVDSCKGRGAPIGLSEKILDKLESNEIRTIADLEAKMRDQFAWWNILAKTADAAVVTRVVDSLIEYRRVCPQVQQDDVVPVLAENGFTSVEDFREAIPGIISESIEKLKTPTEALSGGVV